ncbi:hypothetical protein GHV40_01060 [Devosia sp. D6-9]|nr:hypothetical protein GHV40_01060 [Devosia sp. D6-9]
MALSGRRVRFLVDWDWKPLPMSTIAYRAGQVAFVRLECAEKALNLGKAVLVETAAPPAGVAATIAAKGRKGTRRAGS